MKKRHNSIHKKIIHKLKRWRFRGFTLIESLVVVGIIGLAIGIASTGMNIGRNNENAQDAVRKSDLNTLHKAFVQYFVENRCVPPKSLWDSMNCKSPPPSELLPYLSSVPCDPETNEKYFYETLNNSCMECSGSCGTCAGFRLLTQLKHPGDNDTLAHVGCNKDLGCGKYASNGKPYNYGVIMTNACSVPTPTGGLNPTITQVPTSVPSATPTTPVTPTIDPVQLPLAYWRLTEGSGTTTADNSGKGNLITLVGDPSWTQGKNDFGLQFGTNDAYALSQTNIDLANKSFSIGAWVKRTKNTAGGAVWNMVLSQGSGVTNKGLHLGFANDKLKCGFWGNDSDTITSYSTLNTWMHIACTYDATNNVRKIYYNGSPVYTQAAVTADYSGTGKIKLGGWAWNLNEELQAVVDDVFIYDYVRTPSQILSDMNGQTYFEIVPTPTPTPTPTSTPIPTATSIPTPSPILPDPTITKRILMIGFNPVENGVSYADKYFSYLWGGKNAAQTEDQAFEYMRSQFVALSNNHIQFTLVKKIQITSSVPYPDGSSYDINSYKGCTNGTNLTVCENRKWQFNYNLWLSTNNICQQMQDNNADEIWMFSLPYIMAYENFMIGPNAGFSINGPSYIDSTCSKHYAVVNGTYDRPDLPFHNFGHRIEATMNYLTSWWSIADKQKYWLDFAAISLYSAQIPSKPYCGNGHYPFNTSTAYNVTNSTVKTNNCPDWKNFPTLQGTTTSGACSLWGCTDPGWQSYWFGALPRGAGEATLTSRTGKSFQFSRNWWDYILDPDQAMTKYNSIQ